MKNEHSMQDLIDHFLNKNKKDILYLEREVLKIWDNEMGDFIHKNTRSVEIKNGVLYVKILHASLRFELSGRKSDIIRKLNERVGKEVVKDIVFS